MTSYTCDREVLGSNPSRDTYDPAFSREFLQSHQTTGAVGIMASLQAGRLVFDSRKEPDFYFVHKVQIGSGAQSASYAMGLEVERPGSETDH